MLLLLLHKKESSSFAGSSICSERTTLLRVNVHSQVRTCPRLETRAGLDSRLWLVILLVLGASDVEPWRAGCRFRARHLQREACARGTFGTHSFSLWLYIWVWKHACILWYHLSCAQPLAGAGTGSILTGSTRTVTGNDADEGAKHTCPSVGKTSQTHTSSCAKHLVP